MLWFRRLFVGLLSLCLLISLLATAVSASLVFTLSSPSKVNSWATGSSLYNSFIQKAVERAQATLGPDSQTPLVASQLSQSAKEALAKTDFNRNVDLIINGNYAWLESKVAQPEFRVDLSGNKQTFATDLSTFVSQQVSALPGCSAAQTAQLTSTGPLSLTCRPSFLSPEAAASQIKQSVLSSDLFASNDALTPNSFKVSDQPYYQKLASLPKAYRWVVRLPWLMLALSLILALAILFLAPRKRRGLRRLIIVLILSGLILMALKVIAGPLSTKVDNRLSSGDNIYQPVISTLYTRAEHSAINAVLAFSLFYLALSLLFIIVLASRRNRPPKASETASAPFNEASGIRLSQRRPKTSVDVVSPKPTPKRPKTKPKRLIQ